MKTVLVFFALAVQLAASNVSGCTNRTNFLHSGSNISQACGPDNVSQTTGISTTSNTTVAATAFSVTTGNALAVFTDYHSATVTVTVSDTAGNTFTAGTACDQNGNSHGQWFWSLNVTGNASDVVTATFSLARSHKEITVYQLRNVTAKDFNGACATSSSSVGTATTGSFTTTVAAEMLLIGVSGALNSNSFTAGANYTLGPAVGGAASGQTEFQKVTAIQTGVTASMTFGSNTTYAATVLTIN